MDLLINYVVTTASTWNVCVVRYYNNSWKIVIASTGTASNVENQEGANVKFTQISETPA